MEFLAFIVIVGFIVVIILLLTHRNNVSSRFDLLNHQINVLTNELRKHMKDKATEKEIVPPVTTAAPLDRVKLPEVEPILEKIKELPIPPTPIIPPAPIHSDIPQPRLVPEPVIKKEPVIAPVTPTPRPPVVHPKKPGFFERNPDLEKFIGENLANKIGIAVLVLGIGLFVKLAIDQEWINENGRVFIGIACGGLLLAFAHKMRKTFVAFSSVLVGGGIAVLYLTIAIAFHEYRIFSQTSAFIIMVGITGFTIFLTLSYNRVELAVLSILGAFGSPFMVSTGEGNYVILFTYVMIIDVGMLILAYYKKWNLINIIAYVFTLILFGAWLADRFDGNNVSMIRGAIIFATLFYLTFFAMNLVNNLKLHRKFEALDISMLISTTFLYYAAGMVILDNRYGEELKGLFTAGVGIFNFVFAYFLYRRKEVDRNLVFLLIGLVLTFISLAAPVQLKGNYITMFWAAEAVLLLWLSQQSGIKLMKLGAVVVMAFMVISLTMDWNQIYPRYTSEIDQSLPIIFNRGYITGLFALASIVATVILLKRETTEYREHAGIYKMVLAVAGVGILYVSQFLELNYHTLRLVEFYADQNIVIGVYNILFLLGLTTLGKKLPLPAGISDAFAGWGILGIFLYLFSYHGDIIDARSHYLTGEGGLGFMLHYVLIILLLVLATVSLLQVRRWNEFNQKTHNGYSWFFIFFFVFVASAELDHTVLLSFGATSESMHHLILQNRKIGYPILWGLASFLLIFIGLRLKLKHLRVISLTLMLITLVKLFAFDIQGISKAGMIAALITLGVVLLIVSFMYQRLRKILLTDDNETPGDPKE